MIITFENRGLMAYYIDGTLSWVEDTSLSVLYDSDYLTFHNAKTEKGIKESWSGPRQLLPEEFT